MATIVNEKADAPHLGADTTASRLQTMPSQDTMRSSMSNEKVMGVARTSDVSSPSSVHHANPFDTDIEAMVSNDDTRCLRKSTTVNRGGKADCPVWPGQDHWKQKAKAAKKQRRNYNCLGHLSKRNRLIVKLLIGLIVVGIAVGIGVGISKAVGAPMWRPHDGSLQ